MNEAVEPAIVGAGPAGMTPAGTVEVRADMKVRRQHGARAAAR